MSAQMVRAILGGSKTQTRRLLRGGTWRTPEHGVIRMAPAGLGCTGFAQVECPYGKPGDRLWVKEGWAWHVQAMGADRDETGPFVYAADGSAQQRLCERWRSSRFMPSYASRILLEVVSVRAEKLLTITAEDAVAEGVGELVPLEVRGFGLTPASVAAAAMGAAMGMKRQTRRSFLSGAVAAAAGIAASRMAPCEPREVPGAKPGPKELYAVFWESIHGIGSWAENPDVWVVEFRRVG